MSNFFNAKTIELDRHLGDSEPDKIELCTDLKFFDIVMRFKLVDGSIHIIDPIIENESDGTILVYPHSRLESDAKLEYYDFNETNKCWDDYIGKYKFSIVASGTIDGHAMTFTLAKGIVNIIERV